MYGSRALRHMTALSTTACKLIKTKSKQTKRIERQRDRQIDRQKSQIINDPRNFGLDCWIMTADKWGLHWSLPHDSAWGTIWDAGNVSLAMRTDSPVVVIWSQQKQPIRRGHLNLYWGKGKDQIRRSEEQWPGDLCAFLGHLQRHVSMGNKCEKGPMSKALRMCRIGAWAIEVQWRLYLCCMYLSGFNSPASHNVLQARSALIPEHRAMSKFWAPPLVVNTTTGIALIQSSMTPEIVASTVIYSGLQEQTGLNSLTSSSGHRMC